MGWQDYQPSPTRTLHQQEALTHSSLTRGNIILLSTTVLEAHALPIRVLPIVVHPRTKMELFFLTWDLHSLFLPHGLLTSMHRYSSVLGLTQRAGNCVFFIHGFPCEGPFGWSVVCMFLLTNSWPVHMLPLPSCEVGFSFHSRTV